MHFAPAAVHLTTPNGGWATWSNNYAGDVYEDFGTTLKMTLPSGTGAFYFYAEPDAFGTFTVQAVAQDGATSGPVQVNGAGGATYLGFYGTGGAQVHTITVRAHAAAQGFAVGEFGVAKRISFTSASSDTVSYGSPFSFTVTTGSGGAPALTKSGLLPVGVHFADNGDGTATLSGTPTGRSQGVYPLTFYANGGGFARQAFTLTVHRAPALRHVGTVHAPIGTAMDQPVRATGYPVPALSESGTLPAGLTFTATGTGPVTSPEPRPREAAGATSSRSTRPAAWAPPASPSPSWSRRPGRPEGAAGGLRSPAALPRACSVPELAEDAGRGGRGRSR